MKLNFKMASNLIDEMNLFEPFQELSLNYHSPVESQQIDYGQIETITKPNFEKLDQIIEFKRFLFIVDWKNENCIHVLNSASLDYIRDFQLDRIKGFIHWIVAIEIDQEELLLVLLQKAVCFIKLNDQNENCDLQILNYYDLHLDHLSYKGSRPYGLVWHPRNKNIYFLETNSRKLIQYKLNKTLNGIDLIDEKIFKLSLRFSGSFRCYLREMKLDENRLFITDYKLRNGEGNGCVHLFDLKVRYLDRFGQGLLHSPYSLEFDPNNKKTVFVCEKVNDGKIFVFNETLENIFRLTKVISLNIANPYFFCISQRTGFCYLTHVMGDEYKYDGKPELYRFRYKVLLN